MVLSAILHLFGRTEPFLLAVSRLCYYSLRARNKYIHGISSACAAASGGACFTLLSGGVPVNMGRWGRNGGMVRCLMHRWGECRADWALLCMPRGAYAARGCCTDALRVAPDGGVGTVRFRRFSRSFKRNAL